MGNLKDGLRKGGKSRGSDLKREGKVQTEIIKKQTEDSKRRVKHRETNRQDND